MRRVLAGGVNRRRPAVHARSGLGGADLGTTPSLRILHPGTACRVRKQAGSVILLSESPASRKNVQIYLYLAGRFHCSYSIPPSPMKTSLTASLLTFGLTASFTFVLPSRISTTSMTRADAAVDSDAGGEPLCARAHAASIAAAHANVWVLTSGSPCL